MSWSWSNHKAESSVDTEYLRKYSSISDKSVMTMPMKPGQQGRVKAARDNAEDSLTSTLGVGGRPLIAGF